jgi:hypothetical protein
MIGRWPSGWSKEQWRVRYVYSVVVLQKDPGADILQIQELNYKITVALNSDSKSEVEGLRWVLTRRSVMGILFMAVMVLTSLRYASYKAHEEEMKRKKEIISKPEQLAADLPSEGAAEILAAN